MWMATNVLLAFCTNNWWKASPRLVAFCNNNEMMYVCMYIFFFHSSRSHSSRASFISTDICTSICNSWYVWLANRVDTSNIRYIFCVSWNIRWHNYSFKLLFYFMSSLLGSWILEYIVELRNWFFMKVGFGKKI